MPVVESSLFLLTLYHPLYVSACALRLLFLHWMYVAMIYLGWLTYLVWLGPVWAAVRGTQAAAAQQHLPGGKALGSQRQIPGG